MVRVAYLRDMDADFWINAWREGRTGFHQRGINPNLKRYFPLLDVTPGDAVLVPLCGKSRDMAWLVEQGARVVGVEIAELPIREFFEERGLLPEVATSGWFRRYQSGGYTLFHGDVLDLAPDDVAEVTAVYDRAALIALPPEVRQHYAEKISHVVKPGTRELLLTVEYPQEQIDGPPFAVFEDEVRRLFEPAFDVRQLHREVAARRSPRFEEAGVSDVFDAAYLMTKK